MAAGSTANSRRRIYGRCGLALVGAVTAVVTLAACTSAGGDTGSGKNTGAGTHSPSEPGSSSPTSSAPAAAAVITTSPGRRTSVNPTTPISVHVAHGTLTSITMLNPAGKHVAGAMTSGDAGWHTTEVLGYNKTYTITAHAVNADGKAVSAITKLSTVNPEYTTSVSMDRMGGYGMDDGETFGVAIIPVVHFDSTVSDKAAAQKALAVTTSPKVAGVWSWTSDQDVAYRPRTYWPAGTKVTVAANIYGVQIGKHTYGESDASVHFTVGRKQTTVANDFGPVHKVRVYSAAGKLLRTMKTSMGQHSGETVDGTYINFYTLDGTYTVLEHDNPAIMDSQSYGLPASAPHGYGKLSVPYSTKISTDGIYLHEFNSTIYDQDNGNDVSEGCLNLRTSDAVWFYDHSLVGDPVVVNGAKGAPEISVDEGGDWSVPWSKWITGNAVS